MGSHAWRVIHCWFEQLSEEDSESVQQFLRVVRLYNVEKGLNSGDATAAMSESDGQCFFWGF